jgi:Leucine-rich repeat (LRR) protein
MIKLKFILNLLLFVSKISAYLLPSSNCPDSCECSISDSELELLIIQCGQNPDMFSVPNDFELNKELNGIKQIEIHGEIDSFPQDICFLDNLENIRIQKSKLKTLKPDELTCLDKLQYLYLDNNQIQNIGSNYFADLPELFFLILSNNEIMSIETNAFNNLPKLFLLDLSNNKISYIGNNAFDNLLMLSSLDLSNNLIQQIDAHPFNNLPILNLIDLKNNQKFKALLELKRIKFQVLVLTSPNVMISSIILI